MKRIVLCTVFFGIALCSSWLRAQVILGTDTSQHIAVTTSSNYTPQFWSHTASGEKTINAIGLDGPVMEASRFLSQATLGADLQDIEYSAHIGIEPWIDEQLAMPVNPLYPQLELVYSDMIQWFLLNGGDPEDIGMRPYFTAFNYTWWENHMAARDLLRQRVALALSEILIISLDSDLSSFADGLASYYDVLLKNSFGKYEDLLYDVTLHPTMGFYLTHLNNPREIPAENIHPDENYAREIMQLFTVGLYQLNQDGSRKTDSLGNFIPTYDQTDIKQLARVFTGLGVSDVVPNEWVQTPYFGLDIYVADVVKPMKMYEEWHQYGPKELIDGTIIPEGQNGLTDIRQAVRQLVAHPNVGPFIGKQLIQRLVTSNPSPGYVSRIAAVFADNGEGVRGDLGAVVKAILMDEEARSCASVNEPTFGKLREPILRYTHFTKSLPMEQIYGRFWNVAYGFYESTYQMPLAPRTVFNFFLPDFQPNGPIGDEELVGPEFQIHNSRTSVEYMNRVNDWTVWGYVMDDWEAENPHVFPILDELIPLGRDPEALINRLDKMYTHGMLSQETRQIIKDAITPIIGDDYRDDRVRLALYLLLVSPDYAILK